MVKKGDQEPSTPDLVKAEVAPAAFPEPESNMTENHDETDSDGSVGRSQTRNKRRKLSQTNHTSCFRGVSCCGKDRKFQARIRDGSKVHYLGRYDNEFDAAIKYDEAARSHKGDLAMPNFIKMSEQEIGLLRNHYFESGQRILPEYQHFLHQVYGEVKRIGKKPHN